MIDRTEDIYILMTSVYATSPAPGKTAGRISTRPTPNLAGLKKKSVERDRN